MRIEDIRVPLYLALVHYPVLNRKGEVIASAITNLDLHDLARAACTYEIPVCYIITPLKDQQALAASLVAHWCEGIGKSLHPHREQALRRLQMIDSVASAVGDMEREWGCKPVVWATTAKDEPGMLTHEQARRNLLETQAPHLLLLGTGWGLAPSVFNDVDGVLESIRGTNGYNHLSVRCAAAILIDRLLADRKV